MVKGLLFGALGALILAACANVADLEVTYVPDAGADGGPTTPADGGSADASAPPAAPPVRRAAGTIDSTTLGQPGAPCPCEEAQGLACCSSASGASCTSDEGACAAQRGAYLRCFGPDEEGSFCCLHRYATYSVAALAATCSAGSAIVCTLDSDCPGGKCTLGSCPGGVSVGTCDGTPVCP